jgi:energy-coupling factor transporter ATP-binding protein EcfA2
MLCSALPCREKAAVRGLTMSVSRGECFGLLGPNGAGKSTTLNMLTGFLIPTSGAAPPQARPHSRTVAPTPNQTNTAQRRPAPALANQARGPNSTAPLGSPDPCRALRLTPFAPVPCMPVCPPASRRHGSGGGARHHVRHARCLLPHGGVPPGQPFVGHTDRQGAPHLLRTAQEPQGELFVWLII